MNRLSTFFQGSENGVGGFYPKHHIVAVFPTVIAADEAKRVLDSKANVLGDVISVTGREVLEFVADHVVERGMVGALMREISAWLGTEEQYVEQDLEAAKKGAAFVAVYCPDEESKTGAWAILESTHPLAGRYYSSGGIEHLR
jgi:hypothetical protein